MSALLEWFSDPFLRSMLIDMLLAGIAAAVVCSVLSVIVVLKRLSFVGQGVSHSAFGGLGLAAMLGVVGGLVGGVTESMAGGGGGAMGGGWGWGSVGGVVVVSLFCMAAAVVMGLVSDRRTMTLDASIGAMLAATMAAGFIMLDLARRGVVLGGGAGSGGGGGVPTAESLLFGQIAGVGGGDVVLAWVMAGSILGVLWWYRRPVLFWAFDEAAAPAFGVRATACKLGVLAMLALAIVVSMRLVGVVLVTAMLVLPGATALKLSDRLGRVFAWSVGVGVLGVVLGVMASLALDMQTGPTIVLTLVVLFVLGVVPARILGARLRL